jgi:hypothetical protein
MLQLQQSPVVFSSRSEGHTPFDLTATKTAQLLGKDYTSGKDARYIWDEDSASKQCTALNIVQTKCWICGNDFGNGDFRPQCDHILPVMQGVFFLDLVSKKRGVSEAMKVEYDWAHAVCNNAKRASIFILETPDGGYDINHREIDKLLYKLQQDGIPMPPNRNEKIIEKLQPILAIIRKDNIKGIANLNLLAGTISLLTNTRRGGRRKRTKRNKRRRHTRRR